MKGVKDFKKWVFEFSHPELAHWGGLERVYEELRESGYELLGAEFSDGVRIFVRR